MRASAEQIEIIKASQELRLGQVMKIDACAGSGKTTTLLAVTNANPQKRFLYLAFNRSIADKANQVFPSIAWHTDISFLAGRGQSYRLSRSICFMTVSLPRRIMSFS